MVHQTLRLNRVDLKHKASIKLAGNFILTPRKLQERRLEN